MNREIVYGIVAAVGVLCLPLALSTAAARCCGGGASAAVAETPAPPAGVAGPKGAKACLPGCAKPCCAPKRAPGVNLTAALAALDEAREAVQGGDTRAALAALARARKLVAAAREPAPINATCPMTGRAVKPTATRTYQGSVIGFCGPGCAAAWDRSSDAGKAAVFAKIRASVGASAKPAARYANAVCPIMGGKIDPRRVTPRLTRTFRGQTVAFCCAGCPAAWDRLPDEQKAAKFAGARTK